MTTPHQKPLHLAAALVAFLALEATLYFFADRAMADYVKQLDLAPSSHGLIDFFRSVTDLGLSKWYLVPCGIFTIFCAFLSRGKDVKPALRRLFAYIGTRAFFLFATIAISGIVADIIKPILGRARPLLWTRNHIYGFSPFTTLGHAWNSMPSGHATTAAALAACLITLYPRLRPLWLAFALMIIASRVMVDAHYLSDVVAGTALGWLTVHLFVKHAMPRATKVIFPIDNAATTS